MLRSPASSASRAQHSPAVDCVGDVVELRVDCWVMPDLVGCSLAEAHAAIRIVTDADPLVRTASIDASGEGRDQGHHSDWRVSWQSPQPGSLFRVDALVSFLVDITEEARAATQR